MQVLLLHGMGRTPLSMLGLAFHLRRTKHQACFLGYVAAVEPFARIAQRLRQRLSAIAARGPYVVVGHSLGGLLARAVLAEPTSFRQPAHLIMLGTPNQLPRQAKRFSKVAAYRWFNGESGQLLAQESFFARLSPPSIPYTIIAGTGGRQGRRSPFGWEPHDGMVAVSETLVSHSDVPLTFPVRHTFMMNDARVRRVILGILETAVS